MGRTGDKSVLLQVRKAHPSGQLVTGNRFRWGGGDAVRADLCYQSNVSATRGLFVRKNPETTKVHGRRLQSTSAAGRGALDMAAFDFF